MDTAVDTRAGTPLPEWAAWSLLALGIAAVSVSAILIRYADAAGPLAISFWRCALGALVLAPFARWNRRGLTRSNLTLSVIAGVFLAVHFATWISSVNLTTIAVSVLLVSTTPIWTALTMWLVFRERLPLPGWVGIALTLAGAALIGGGDFEGASASGNILALIGGATVGGYLLLGAHVRRDLGIVEYAVIAYAASAVLLLPVCVVAGEKLWGYDAQTWWAIAGLVAGPQLLGHTVINTILGSIDTTTIAVTIMAEPIVATALAYLLFDEVPSVLIYPGGLLVLLGIYLVTTVRRVPTVPLE
ncbi:MAG: DMT family transporter [Actinomycetota bacterium]